MRPQRVHAFRNDDALGRHDAVALAQLVAAGEVHPDIVVDEASEWVARAILSLTTVPGRQLDVNDPEAVLSHVRRYVMTALRADPAV